MRLQIINARVVDARGERRETVCVEGGRIVPSLSGEAHRVINAQGLVLAPGLTDTHCHLRDPGYPQKETMETGMRAALRGGYVTLCAMANTLPVMETPALVAENHRRAEALGLCRLVQAGAAGVGLGEETPTDRAALATVTRVISNDGKTIFSDDFMRRLLMDSRKHGFLISTHCQPERATVKRDLALLKEVGGNLHIGHISTKETVAMIRAAKADMPEAVMGYMRGSSRSLTCEVMPHHLFVWDDPYKVNPPIRAKEDAEALIAGIADGTIDCLATDHAPHTPDDKAAGMAGISNIEHALAIFLKVFYDNNIPLTRLFEMAAGNTALLLGTGTGLIAPGERADLILVDPDAPWVIQKDTMISRSHNTPFEGRQVRGKVLITIRGGNILYDHGQTLS